MAADEYLQAVLLGRETLHVIDNAAARSLPAGDHFPTHLHNTVDLILCTEGSITLTLFQTPLTLGPGEYLVIYPHIPHCSDAGPAGCGILQLHFHTEAFRRLVADALKNRGLYFLLDVAMDRRRFLKRQATEQFYDCVLYLGQELEQKRPNYRRMCDLYLFQLILLLSRQVGEGMAPGSPLGNRHLMLAAQYIRQHYAEKITAAQVAEYCGITPRRLTALFSETLNMNFSTYLIYFRINKAIELMELRKGRCSLTRLALDTGFGSPAHFSRMFKEKMGMPPARYFGLQKGGPAPTRQ